MSVTMKTSRGHLGVSSAGRSDDGPYTRVEAGEQPGSAVLNPYEARELALELLERSLTAVAFEDVRRLVCAARLRP